MSRPRATYRLQLRGGMDFDRAAGLAPYLARLGISHLYASPPFQAREGSSHGYDVTDHGRLDPALGGMPGFLRLAAALRAHGLGLILDIVPNHMAASPEGPWWRDVLRHGRYSGYAGHFDIDWTAPKLVLPVLAEPWGRVLEDGALRFGRAPDGPVLRYHEHAWPLDPRTWHLLLDAADTAPPGFAARVADPAHAARLDERLAALSRDRALLERVHAAQPWRLVHWRLARDGLTHRRFFEIAELVGVRVEVPRVFDDVHRLVLELLEAGHVQGLRIDHVDGLADPAGYLRRLRDAAPGGTPLWVEKILAPDEPLRASWPVAGTTGYEHARLVAGLLTDGQGQPALTAAYHDFIGARADPAALLEAAKGEILTWNLAGELERLVALSARAAAADPAARDLGPDTLRRALVALAVAMPVYRTYLAGGAAAAVDTACLEQAGGAAARSAALEDSAAVADLVRIIRSASGAAAALLRTRLEQTTGALMAKAMEDTLFYRYTRLLSCNEVGGEPDPIGLPPGAFDRAVAARAAAQPGGLNATATHDTKRGEDARLRIAAIADAPRRWSEAVARWDAMLGGDGAPDPGMRWLFYQALLGAWDPRDPELGGRLREHLIKAAREAKTRTSWTAPDAAYEQALAGLVERALAPGSAFPAAFEAGARPFIEAGERKSLVQLTLKLTLPGVPDIYQGTEWADLSLVDPDNRRAVDFEARAAALDTEPGNGFDGRKMALMRALLGLRRRAPALFEAGDYRRLDTRHPPPGRCFGFARRHGDDAVVAVICELSAPPARRAGEPVFVTPPGCQEVLWQAIYPEGDPVAAGAPLAPADGFARSPVRVLAGGRALAGAGESPRDRDGAGDGSTVR